MELELNVIVFPTGNDLPFDESLCEQGRNFSNKIWNAFRLIKGWKVTDFKKNHQKQLIIWFENKINKSINEINESFSKYRISEDFNDNLQINMG